MNLLAKIFYQRNCPECNRSVSYTTKWSFDYAIKNNSRCKHCFLKGPRHPRYGKKLSEEQKLKSAKTWFRKGQRPLNADFRKGKTLFEIYGNKSEKIRELYRKRPHTLESNIKRSESCKKAKCGQANKGRKCTEENRKKFRLQMIERLQATHKNFHPGYNKHACEFFNKIMQKTKTNIQHALNGGEFYIKELGYWVDGYDKENNIIYEFDEKRINYDIRGDYKEKDKIKQKEITEFLNCKFIRIKMDDVAEIKNRKFVKWKNQWETAFPLAELGLQSCMTRGSAVLSGNDCCETALPFKP